MTIKPPIANLNEAAQLLTDIAMYGMAFVDADGYRVDPTRVVIAPDGTSALDTGGQVYKPAPITFKP